MSDKTDDVAIEEKPARKRATKKVPPKKGAAPKAKKEPERRAQDRAMEPAKDWVPSAVKDPKTILRAKDKAGGKPKQKKDKKPLPWNLDGEEEAAIDRAFGVAQWWAHLSESSNEAFLPLYFCESRYLVLMGGAGSGKSIFAGRKILERVTTERNHRFLVCRKIANTLRKSCFDQLCGQLSAHYPDVKWSANQTDLVITIQDTGSQILFVGLSDVERLKSIYGITSVWVEEAAEVEEDDFLELDRRLRGDTPHYQQIILSFNPISAMHWLKRRFFDREHPGAVTHRSNYKSNKFLPQADRERLEAYRDTDPYHYAVYCLGEWGITGTTVFDGAAITRQINRRIEPVLQGDFSYEYSGTMIYNIRFNQSYAGAVRIYKEPENGAPYVIGADTAGDGSDSFVAQVLDNRTGEQVATLRQQYDEDTFARELFCLGLHYNTALIGVEANFSTYPIRELQRLGYPKQYVRETADTFKGRFRNSYGFMTTAATRPLIIATLVEFARENPELIVDRTTLLEMSTFVRNEKMRAEAEPGAHDDCVMALAIAHYIRPQQSRGTDVPDIARMVKWTPDMWEDYTRATPDQRRYLLDKWGRPSNYHVSM